MRQISKLLLLVWAGSLAGCGDGVNHLPPDAGAFPDARAPDAGAGITTTIQITTDPAPRLVLFREGTGGVWQSPTARSATVFDAKVRGSYTVVVVCTDSSGNIVTTQYLRTLEDPRQLDGRCSAPPAPPTHKLTGHMVQPGFVRMGGEAAQSATPEWDFELAVPAGTYDVIFTTASRIGVSRGLVINQDRALTAPVDLSVKGDSLVDATFTVPNAVPGETLQAAVGLLNATNPNIPARLYLGPAATAKVAPDDALLATDTQSVSVRAITPTTLRALRRPFRVGGNAAYVVPDAIGNLTWTTSRGALSASWTTLPPIGLLAFSLFGENAGGFTSHNIDVSPSFVATTGATRVTFETELPGFQPAWRVDLSRTHDRQVFAQQGQELGVLTTVTFSETIGNPAARAAGAASARRPAGALIP